jgi:hypothetical protein
LNKLTQQSSEVKCTKKLTWILDAGRKNDSPSGYSVPTVITKLMGQAQCSNQFGFRYLRLPRRFTPRNDVIVFGIKRLRADSPHRK